MSASPAITEEILRHAIGQETGLPVDSIEILKVEEKDGCGEGNSFASSMRAVSVKARIRGVQGVTEEGTCQYEYMVKLSPVGLMATFAEETAMFPAEVESYCKLLPALIDLQKDKNNGISIPKVFYGSAEERVLIMENLKKSGFTMIDKQKGLDLEQLQMVLDTLATLHATSYHLIQTYPGGLVKFKADYPTTKHLFWLGEASPRLAKFAELFLFKLTREIFMSAAHAEEDLDQNLLERMSNTFERVTDLLHENLAVSEDNFNCIIHADVWTNNVMFKTEDGQQQMKLLDFQLIHYNRPTIDLAYLLWSSSSSAFRRENLSDLLRHYHKKISEQLQFYGYVPADTYSFEQFYKDLKDCRLFMIIVARMHAYIQIGAKSPIKECGGQEEMDGMYTAMLNNKLLKEKTSEIVKEVAESDFFKGLF